MKLSERSYPHPVIGNRDDAPNASFQASIQMSSDKENIYIDVEAGSNSLVLESGITAGDICYLLHVDCSNTFFRKSFSFNTGKHRQMIASENLNDLIEVNVFAVAAKKITGYQLAEAHSDYGNISFEISEGDILAVSDTMTFHIDSQFDSMRRIGSIMQIVQNPKPDSDLPLAVDLNGDKIIILMSKQDFGEYKLLKTNEFIVGPLTVAVVLPVLVEALQYLKNEFLDSEDDECPRWAVVLKRRIKMLDLAGEDPLIAAQRLLELPIKRALASTRALIESEY